MGQGHLACQIGSRGMALRIIGIDHGSKEQLVKDCGAEVFIDSAYSCSFSVAPRQFQEQRGRLPKMTRGS